MVIVLVCALIAGRGFGSQLPPLGEHWLATFAVYLHTHVGLGGT